MALVVVGGHTRNIGKTSVVAGLIAALPEFDWTAIKITQYGHGICSADGEACDCATADHSIAVSEERQRASGTDSSRYLAAGARHSWWVRTQQGELHQAMPRVRKLIESAEHIAVAHAAVSLRGARVRHARLSRVRQESPATRGTVGLKELTRIQDPTKAHLGGTHDQATQIPAGGLRLVMRASVRVARLYMRSG